MQVMMAEVKEASTTIEGEIFCLEAMFPTRKDLDQDPLYAFKASAEQDTMYLHQAMEETDKKEFIEAMQKEVSDQMRPTGNINFSIVHRSTVPEGATILPSVWQMKCKQDIKTKEVKKWKAHLNIDGSRMQKGRDYWETYAPSRQNYTYTYQKDSRSKVEKTRTTFWNYIKMYTDKKKLDVYGTNTWWTSWQMT